VCSTVLGLRKARGLRVRLPLASVTVAAADAERLRPFTQLIADEVNVKAVHLSTDVDAHGRFELAVNARALGPRLGKQVQAVIKAVKAGEWSPGPDGTVLAAGEVLNQGEFTQRLVAVEPDSTAAVPGGEGLVVLDLAVTEELEAEGWARDRVRELQEVRRSMNLPVSQRIRLTLAVPVERAEWAELYRELVAREVLAVELTLVDLAAGGAVELGDGVWATLDRAGAEDR
jgi:isoleucyl-tRNA synthetase